MREGAVSGEGFSTILLTLMIRSPAGCARRSARLAACLRIASGRAAEALRVAFELSFAVPVLRGSPSPVPAHVPARPDLRQARLEGPQACAYRDALPHPHGAFPWRCWAIPTATPTRTSSGFRLVARARWRLRARTFQWTEVLARLRGAKSIWGPGCAGGAPGSSWLREIARPERRSRAEKEDYLYNFANSGAACKNLMDGRFRQAPRLVAADGRGAGALDARRGGDPDRAQRLGGLLDLAGQRSGGARVAAAIAYCAARDRYGRRADPRVASVDAHPAGRHRQRGRRSCELRPLAVGQGHGATSGCARQLQRRRSRRLAAAIRAWLFRRPRLVRSRLGHARPRRHAGYKTVAIGPSSA